MKKKHGITLALLFTCLCYTQAQKKHFKVTPKNANFKQIIQQITQIPGNDTIVIEVNSGFYPLSDPILINKPLNHPIVIKGINKPILSGGFRVSNWEITPQGWWKTKISESANAGFRFEQFYINGRRATRARTPDEGWFKLKNVEQSIIDKGTGRFANYAVQSLSANPSDLKTLRGLSTIERSDVMAAFYHKWDNTRKPLDYFEVDSGKVVISGSGMHPWNPLRKGTRYVLENYKKALTAPGEWFLDREGFLYYIPLPGESPKTAQCIVPKLERIVLLEGSAEKSIQNIQIKNISFQHASYLMPKKGNEPQQAAASISAAIELKYANHISFENCEIKHTGNYAYWFKAGCNNNQVRHSYLTDLGAGGLKIGETTIPANENEPTHHITIDNNIIHDLGYVFPCAVGVAIFHADHNKITHNDIADLRYSAVSIGWIWGYSKSPAHHNIVAYNHLHHIGWGALSDMGAVYTLGISPGTHIHHNVIHDVYSYDYGGWGLYTDEGSSNVLMEDNLVYRCKSGGFHQHYGKNNTIRNNIFAFGELFQLQFTRPEKHRSINFYQNIILMNKGNLLQGNWKKAKIKMDKNCYWDISGKHPLFFGKKLKAWRKETQNDLHSIIANPYFKDASNYDFHFKSRRSIRKIGFKPFDYTLSGVYGSPEWKKKALLSPELLKAFNAFYKK